MHPSCKKIVGLFKNSVYNSDAARVWVAIIEGVRIMGFFNSMRKIGPVP